MRHAVELLEAGSAPVRDVAMTVGYRQPAQFAKAFRRHLGVAPSDYRAREAAMRFANRVDPTAFQAPTARAA
jgi:AraC-like DNA-binding protein